MAIEKWQISIADGRPDITLHFAIFNLQWSLDIFCFGVFR